MSGPVKTALGVMSGLTPKHLVVSLPPEVAIPAFLAVDPDSEPVADPDSEKSS